MTYKRVWTGLVAVIVVCLLVSPCMAAGGGAAMFGGAAVKPAGVAKPAKGAAGGFAGYTGGFRARAAAAAKAHIGAEKALDKIIDIDFKEQELKDVLEYLRAKSGVNMHVHWDSLEHAGIKPTLKVTVKLKGVTVRQALDTILADFIEGRSGKQMYGVKLEYVVEGSVIKIATHEYMDKYQESIGTQSTEIKMYDVRELIESIGPTKEDGAEKLRVILVTHVGLEAWVQSGGKPGIIDVAGSVLVIKQTPENHRLLAKLLEEMKVKIVDRPPTPRAKVEHAQRQMQFVGQLKNVCFNYKMVGMVAVGGLSNDVPRKDDEVIADLENQLTKIKSIGLRNAIHLTLKDMYRAKGDNKKVLEHLRSLLKENDQILAKEAQFYIGPPWRGSPGGGFGSSFGGRATGGPTMMPGGMPGRRPKPASRRTAK